MIGFMDLLLARDYRKVEYLERRLSFLVFISLLLLLLCQGTNSLDIEVRNDCPYTVWAAAVWATAVPVGGGRQLDQGQTWNINLIGDFNMTRIWARTNCTFDKVGNGKCVTGDCNGTLQCTIDGNPPKTIAEFITDRSKNIVMFDIALNEGFNVPMEIKPDASWSTKCNMVRYGEDKFFENNMYISLDVVNAQIGFPNMCPTISCVADINKDCPPELRVSGGCHHPCTVFKNDIYCCTSTEKCRETYMSKYFKGKCPNARTYNLDTLNESAACFGDYNFSVVFCPRK